MRDQLGPFAELAEQTNIALSAVTHPAKNAGPRALDHFIGSQAFIASARLAHLNVAEMEQNEQGKPVPTGRKLFTSVQKNICIAPSAIAYRVAETIADGVKTTKIVWQGIVDVSADEALAAAVPVKRDKEGVTMFLLNILANGPAPQQLVEERTEKCNFSEDQLKYAEKKMGIVVFKEKAWQGRWFWALPQHAPQNQPEEEIT